MKKLIMIIQLNTIVWHTFSILNIIEHMTACKLVNQSRLVYTLQSIHFRRIVAQSSFLSKVLSFLLTLFQLQQKWQHFWKIAQLSSFKLTDYICYSKCLFYKSTHDYSRIIMDNQCYWTNLKPETPQSLELLILVCQNILS